MAVTTNPAPAPAGGVADFGLERERPKSWLEQRLGPDTYRIVRGLATNPLSVTGIILLVMFFAVAAFAPFLAPQPPYSRDPYLIPRDGFSDTPRPPMSSWDDNYPDLPFWWKPIMGTDHWVHIFGTAAGQFDIWYGVVWGTRTALFVGIVITACTLVIGLTVGSLSGFYGGRLDDLLMRITEIFMAFPFLLAALTLSAILGAQGKTIWPATIALITFGWMTYARLIRGDILTTKERDYVLAARTIGVNDGGILLRHIIPNAVYPTLVVASLDIGSYVLNFAALSFLGVGTEVGYADWGQILSFARAWISQLADYWYILIYPGVALILFGLAWNLVGDALRDVMDPKLKGRGV